MEPPPPPLELPLPDPEVLPTPLPDWFPEIFIHKGKVLPQNTLEQNETNTNKRSRWQEIIKLRAEISQLETENATKNQQY